MGSFIYELLLHGQLFFGWHLIAPLVRTIAVREMA